MLHPVRLGINIDHIATLRNARGGAHPCPIRAAHIAAHAGADGITAHLREDRRHIRDDDMRRLKAEVALPLNFEMAATEEMLMLALSIRPHACCLVPEKRAELTTEGGLDVVANVSWISALCRELRVAGIRSSLFVDAAPHQIEAAKACEADIVELHTGAYCEGQAEARAAELARIQQAATLASSLGLEVHAGHGLSFESVREIAAIPSIRELNIGHFLMGEAVFVGLESAIWQMRQLIDQARTA